MKKKIRLEKNVNKKRKRRREKAKKLKKKQIKEKQTKEKQIKEKSKTGNQTKKVPIRKTRNSKKITIKNI